MSALAESSAVKALPGGSGYDDETIAAALSWASSVIRSYTHQQISAVENDVVTVTPLGFAAQLPELPVSSVSLVEVLRTDFSTGAQTWDPITAYGVSDDGWIYPTQTGGRGWPGGIKSLRVTYTHGFETVPDAIVDCAARLALHYLTNPTLRLEYKIGEKSERWAAAMLSPYDEMILDNYIVIGIA